MQLALRVVKAPGARPAVGAAEDRLIAVIGANAVKLTCGEIQRSVPVELHVLVVGVTAPVVGAGAVGKPAAPDRRLSHPRAGAVGVGDVRDRGGRVRVVGVRPGIEQLPVVGDLGDEGAPVGARLDSPDLLGG